MKECPVCHAVCFDDMQVCFGCMHRFDEEPEEIMEPPEEIEQSFLKVFGSSGNTSKPQQPASHENEQPEQSNEAEDALGQKVVRVETWANTPYQTNTSSLPAGAMRRRSGRAALHRRGTARALHEYADTLPATHQVQLPKAQAGYQLVVSLQPLGVEA